MKEKTIYALLMTMIPGLALAAERSESENTPITIRTLAKKKEIEDALLGTPALENKVRQRLRLDILPPDRAQRMLKQATTLERQKRDEEMREANLKIDKEAIEDRKKRDIEKKKERAQKKATEREELMAASQREREKKLKENQELASTLRNLEKTIEEQEKEIETAKVIGTVSEQLMAEMEEMLEGTQKKA